MPPASDSRRRRRRGLRAPNTSPASGAPTSGSSRLPRPHEAASIVEVDLDFHSAIVAVLDSSRLDAFYAELMVELRFYLVVLSVEDREFERPEDLLVEHKDILKTNRVASPLRKGGSLPHRPQRLTGVADRRRPR